MLLTDIMTQSEGVVLWVILNDSINNNIFIILLKDV
jgi:hypothetical protein